MNLDEKMILLATAFLFLPYQIASVAVACVLIQALCRHKLVDAIKNQTGAIFFYSFIVLEFIVSIFHSVYMEPIIVEVSQKIHLKRCVILLLFYRYLRLSTVCISLIRFRLRMDEHF